MIGNKKLLAIIPARGGSKRLPRKNVLSLGGKPLIGWTIQAALRSRFVDHVVVSTDDEEIKDISIKYGADIPFMRPYELATDEATSVDVVLHLLRKLEEENKFYNYIILLQPTSPLRTAKNIDESVELLLLMGADAVISVCEAEHSPLWCNKIPEDGDLSGFLDYSLLNKRSQDLEKYYRLNGAIYLCNADILKKEKTFFFSSRCYGYKMMNENSVDIDNSVDFALARCLLESLDV